MTDPLPVQCSRCGDRWPIDPAFGVACPVPMCWAEKGRHCLPPRNARAAESGAYGRATGHAIPDWEPEPEYRTPGSLTWGPHRDRDRLAAETIDNYGRCSACDVHDVAGQGFLLPGLERPAAPAPPRPRKEPRAAAPSLFG